MAAAATRARVFFLPWDARARLRELIDTAGLAAALRPGDLAAVKIHFGERGNDGYIRPELVRPVVDAIRQHGASPFLTDTGAIYRGCRNDAVSHLAVAAEHGFTPEATGAPVIIADGLRGDDGAEVAIGGTHFRTVKIADAILEADAIIALSHVKGHLVVGFGGAIKNLGMGCGTRPGKYAMHSGVAPTIEIANCIGCGACVEHCNQEALALVDGKVVLDLGRCVGCGECVVACDYGALEVTWSQGTAAVQERFAEYAAGAVKGRRAFYVNFVNHITPNCDCMGRHEEPLCPDVGILASTDPVAIDQASYDLVCQRSGDVFKQQYPHIDSSLQLAHAAKMGMGTRSYDLVSL